MGLQASKERRDTLNADDDALADEGWEYNFKFDTDKCGNFDIMMTHRVAVSCMSQRCAPRCVRLATPLPRCVRLALLRARTYRMVIGAADPMACPIRIF